MENTDKSSEEGSVSKNGEKPKVEDKIVKTYEKYVNLFEQFEESGTLRDQFSCLMHLRLAQLKLSRFSFKSQRMLLQNDQPLRRLYAVFENEQLLRI
jgi:hypothetical protein